MSAQQRIIQIRETAPNPVAGLSGYEPTTDYWPKIVRLCNAMMAASHLYGQNAKTLQRGANLTLTSQIFPGSSYTAVEWAELVMAINHSLWMLHSVFEERQIEELEPVLQALNDLYYEWHDKALNTLKGGDLSTYLHITD